MHCVCQQFLSGARFTEQQYIGVELRGASPIAFQFQTRRTVADKIGETVFRTAVFRQFAFDLRQLIVQLGEFGDQGLQVLQSVLQGETHCAGNLALLIA